MNTIIEKTTAAAASALLTLGADPRYYKPSVPFTLYLTGTMSGDEKAVVQYRDGGDWITAKVNGDEIKLDADTNVLTLYGPLIFRVLKFTTAAPAGVMISKIQGV